MATKLRSSWLEISPDCLEYNGLGGKASNSHYVCSLPLGQQQPLTILSNSGAGIGGLTLSAALRSMNHEKNLDINIYEASSRISEIGAGINVWARTWGIAKAIGLEKKLARFLPRVLREGDKSPGEVHSC